jgi:hypothetical protein
MGTIMKSRMMRAAFAALFFAGGADAGIKSKELAWRLPEPATRVYAVEVVSLESKGGVEKQVRSVTRCLIESRKTDTGYLQEWRDSMISHEYTGYDDEQKKMLGDMFKAAENLPVKVALTKDGAYESVLNVAEWAALFKTAMDKVFGDVQAATLAKLPADKRAEAKAQMEKRTSGIMTVMTSPAYVQKQLEKIPFAYSFFNGGGLDPTQAYELEDSTANPFGGEPFPIKLHVEISLDEEDPGFVYALYKTRLDQDKGRPALAAAIRQIVGKDAAGVDAEIEKLLKEFEISTEVNSRISLKTGAVHWMEYVESKQFPGSVEVTTTEMTLEDAAK